MKAALLYETSEQTYFFKFQSDIEKITLLLLEQFTFGFCYEERTKRNVSTGSSYVLSVHSIRLSRQSNACTWVLGIPSNSNQVVL